ncbi:cation:proton antiporter subunit C [Paralimibaculum aggregatum]|uniref:Cation:proton antiporter subunit C n=1 Tax=Paralimibaculum aggregatum TaxID=3036245 RepID=A0ABQ6LRL3_9RHOB|nr:cation:proton antiporter subunit C [Limibaculum sp. NKW23]GMG84338.1 cation:proton antiporter subunit C [Limibaculum sp. NKW23]
MELISAIVEHYNYWAVIFLMVGGLYIVVAKSNMIKTLIGMALFQTSVYLLYLSPGKVLGGTPPILDKAIKTYSNPLPHVLILTAIVVGVATLAMGLALIVRINEAYGSIEEDEVIDLVDREDAAE